MRRPGGYFRPFPTLLLLDSATSHHKPDVKEAIEKEKIQTKIIHDGLTPLVQYLDTHVNKSIKAGMREKWEHWLEAGERECTKSGKHKRVSYEQICK